MDREERKELESAVESILFASGEPVHVDRFCVALSIERAEAEEILCALRDYYAFERRGIRLLQLEDSWQLCSSPDNGEAVRKAFEIRKPAKLSQPALEALTIVAYYQPITRAYVDKLRGVDSAYTMSLLLERGLIETCGRLQVPGRPLLYRTTEQFLRAFHLSSLDDLPPLPEGGAVPDTPSDRPGKSGDGIKSTGGSKSGVLPDQLSLSENPENLSSVSSEDTPVAPSGNPPIVPRYPVKIAENVPEMSEQTQAPEESTQTPEQTETAEENAQAVEQTDIAEEEEETPWSIEEETLWNMPAEFGRVSGKPRRVRRRDWKRIRKLKPGQRAKRARVRAKRRGQRTNRHAPPEQADAAESGIDRATETITESPSETVAGNIPFGTVAGEIPPEPYGQIRRVRIRRIGRWMRCLFFGCWVSWPWWQCFC